MCSETGEGSLVVMVVSVPDSRGLRRRRWGVWQLGMFHEALGILTRIF
jgi:hypothetical protein